MAEYPRYLLNGAARLFEPATAAIPLTVGAIAESSNTPPMGSGNVALRPVAAPNQPSPFTRTGPGPNGIIKPDLCDYGGNLLFDGTLQTLVSYDEAAVLTLHHEYLRRLLTTTVGTSLAAPRVAHKAAQLLRTFPEASANLIRAFLVSSAQVPEATIQCLQGLGPQAAANVCGNGIADLTRAQTSDNNRVVLYAQDAIGLDRFFVYEIPIPEEFIGTPGERQIQVTLAFDPPTRHTRIDYLGTRMSFRLNRGMTLEQVVEFYRRRTKDEGEVPDVAQRFNCDLNPGPNVRDKCTVQKAVFSMHINPRIDYGDTYYLVVRCERQWAGDEDSPQKFAAVVEISHRTENSLYERIKERLRVRVRA